MLSPYDGLSLGIIAALRATGTARRQAVPIVTGQDAEVQSVKSIMAGEQYSTIFKDTRELAKVTVDMITPSLEGEEPEVNDTETYDNGVKVVPSYLLDPVTVDKDDVQVGPGRLRLLHRGRVKRPCRRRPGADRPTPHATAQPTRKLQPWLTHPRDARHHQEVPGRQGPPTSTSPSAR